MAESNAQTLQERNGIGLRGTNTTPFVLAVIIKEEGGSFGRPLSTLKEEHILCYFSPNMPSE